jgi:unsaturated rhamnogalacturonyl hydrolase
MRALYYFVVACVAIICAAPTLVSAQTSPFDKSLAVLRQPGLIHSAIGVTRKGTAIPCVISPDDLDFDTKKTRVLLVAGMLGDDSSAAAAIAAMRWFYQDATAKALRDKYVISIVPCVNPDASPAGSAPGNGSGGNPAKGYPPKGESYNSKSDPEAQYLWRWIGMHGPDLVVELRASKDPVSDDELVSQLSQVAACGTGTIPAKRLDCTKTTGPELLAAELKLLDTKPIGPSAARKELQRRVARDATTVATQLSKYYGHDLKQIAYIPAMALVGRVRLGELTNDSSHLADVEKIVAMHLEKPPAINAKTSGSEIAGYQIFSLLAEKVPQKKAAYLKLAKAAADVGFDADGKPLKSMPNHTEMSDAVFMGCPILAQVGHLTGDQKYFDQCLQHMRFMIDLNVRKDGLHRHSPLDEAAWGRGNGFPALGLSLALTEIPANFAGREEILKAHRAHLEALIPHQDATGCWHQVIDRPESYRELSSTCMITFAMARGVRLGWLDREKFEPAIRRGWYAVRSRVAADGSLVDICTGTGKQKSLRDYYDRGAILGRDPRGGAMSLLVATEIAAGQEK